MKPYLFEIKKAIKDLAAEGRRLRSEARKLSHKAKYNRQREADRVGFSAREHLLAYHALRGRHPALSESPNTRWRYPFPETKRVVALVDLCFGRPLL